MARNKEYLYLTFFQHNYTGMLPKLTATALNAWQNIVLLLLESRKWQLHLTSSVGMQYFTYSMAKYVTHITPSG